VLKNEYQLRGNRVAIQSLGDIRAIANLVCKATRLRKNKPVHFDMIFESLRSIGIEYDIVDDDDWLPITSGCFNPTTGIISLPQSVFMGACDNNYEDLHIGFHEIGHALLAHKPLMHYSLLPAVQEEDAEWQADMFADFILKKIGMERSLQLDLFYKDKA
jgi:hypothetical protein